eukprot:CAMPEP_0174340086 /NCGR_PEP_ID=MMETSP0810-20121108/24424_1 /TAXON_ID=73025 ORGANISM="Eutreptiella gymnastica-like, Strain CCMP1594" /NCGR_SAMPLE_ID=MMETSP0810 /ASSEMBLY_ACC=CAM_ASM_000659 /LENGTH=79 /DNA_ID=CAMNT_0015461099 /DNA_START=56 /DNA_END=295 /DNA_ORIENTATION=-
MPDSVQPKVDTEDYAVKNLFVTTARERFWRWAAGMVCIAAATVMALWALVSAQSKWWRAGVWLPLASGITVVLMSYRGQ